MPRALRENGLSLVFGLLFLLALAGQSLAGWHVATQDAHEHGQQAMSYGRFVLSSDFGRAVLENWQSEYLQFALFILLTIWFVQRGSPESKELGSEGEGSDAEQLVGANARADSPAWARARDWRHTVYAHSLVLVMFAIFFATWIGQSLTGWRVENDVRAEHGQAAQSWLDFVLSAQFWEQTLQNWQSEFLAVGSFAILAVYLRQRGSSESKPVGAPHDATGVSA